MKPLRFKISLMAVESSGKRTCSMVYVYKIAWCGYRVCRLISRLPSSLGRQGYTETAGSFNIALSYICAPIIVVIGVCFTIIRKMLMERSSTASLVAKVSL